MTKIKERSLSNRRCKLQGLKDRVFRQVRLIDGGVYDSGFIESRKHFAIKTASTLINETQERIYTFRTRAEEIIASFDDESIDFIKSKSTYTIQEIRKRDEILNKFKELTEIRNEIKKSYVCLESNLIECHTDLRRQLTAYFIAAVSKKKQINLEKNISFDYTETPVYKVYLYFYKKTDQEISDAVNSIVSFQAVDAKLKEA